ncbi:MAG: phytoene/squalene synthase family protein [Chloroflexota bacterium]|nr:phytoene/squalene synthase family protein [Chloroflexota bacterium]
MRLGVSGPWGARDQTPFGGIIRTKARSFAFAARFLDPERRRATEVLYAFFRTVDDLVDERPPDADVEAIRAELLRWSRYLAAPTRSPLADDPLARALAATLDRYAIPPSYLLALVRGLEDDLDGRPIETEDDLETYSFRVAATVGLAMCHVLGATSRRALVAASALGIAMQLTNIIRDVADDLDRGRCYVPGELLDRFPGARDALAERRMNAPLRAVLHTQVGRARRYYRAGLCGLAELPPDARFPIAVAAELYGRILDVVERRDCDVFAGRASIGRRSKLVGTARLALAMRTRAVLGRDSGTEADPEGSLGRAALAELLAVGAPSCPPPSPPRMRA